MCVVDVRVRLRSSVEILDEALDLTADLCTALFLQTSVAEDMNTRIKSEERSKQKITLGMFTGIRLTVSPASFLLDHAK